MIAAVAPRGDELRGLMRFYPQGVSVLTVEVEGERMGVTISSLVSISLDPPLIGVSIGKQASLYELLRRAGTFGISVLGADQDALAQRFAAGFPPIVHWQGVETRRGAAGVAPLLDGARGWIEASVRDAHDAGDHTLYVADVLSVELGAGSGGLVYFDRAYRGVA
jgi:3-hydroxy-9,10-secoandrosta-1,3,5(10)-triene-9,17-dione monooxygenase reductase component